MKKCNYFYDLGCKFKFIKKKTKLNKKNTISPS